MVDSKTSHCPKCGAYWFSGEIPEEYWENYSPPYFYSRLIAWYDRDLDVTVKYICPDCGEQFNAF